MTLLQVEAGQMFKFVKNVNGVESDIYIRLAIIVVGGMNCVSTYDWVPRRLPVTDEVEIVGSIKTAW